MTLDLISVGLKVKIIDAFDFDDCGTYLTIIIAEFSIVDEESR